MNPKIQVSPPRRSTGLLALAAIFLIGVITSDATAKMPEGEDEKTFYFIGVILAKQPPFSMLEVEEIDLVTEGLRDSLSGKAGEMDPTVYGPKVQAIAEGRMAKSLEKEKTESTAYVKKAGESTGAKTTESGLVFEEIETGSGDSPKPTDTVKVHYNGTLRDGTVFDSSVERGEPIEFALNRVIPCWTEGLTMMKPGGKAKLVCPSDIAYGDSGAPPVIPGGAALTFEVELLEVKPVSSE